MKIVKIDKEVPEVSAKTTKEHAIAEVLGERDEEDPHTLVELLVCDTEELYGCLAHLDDLALWKIVSHSEIFLFYVQFFSDFLPFSRSECLLDVLRHVGENESVHDEAVVSLLLALYSRQLGHNEARDMR